MKKIIIVLFLIVLIVSCNAQTPHTHTYYDTTEVNILKDQLKEQYYIVDSLLTVIDNQKLTDSIVVISDISLVQISGPETTIISELIDPNASSLIVHDSLRIYTKYEPGQLEILIMSGLKQRGKYWINTNY